jgi:hypothetical protein
VLLVATIVAPVHAWSPDPILGGGMFRPNQALTFHWGNAAAVPLELRFAIALGAVDATGSRLSRAPTFAFDSAGTSAVNYGAPSACDFVSWWIGCFHRYPPDGFTIWFREDGHRFDWGAMRWCELSGQANGCFEAETVMIDELGHVADLDHHVNLPDGSDFTDAVVQASTRTKPQVGWSTHAFGRCDVATLQALYDVLSATTPYSTCSDIPSRLTVTAGKSSTTAGSMVVFTATLVSDGSGLLRGNAVAGRTVVLQQRSGSTWSDIVTMGAGATAGTYATSVNMWSTADYRAIFRKPSAEGLRGSTSAAVTVTVTAACTLSCPSSTRGTR